ncbi:hypothetical protein KI387_031728, partial [Taxus chinensis]
MFEKSSSDLDNLLSHQRSTSDKAGLGFNEDLKDKEFKKEDKVPNKEFGEPSTKEEVKVTNSKENEKTKHITQPNAL